MFLRIILLLISSSIFGATQNITVSSTAINQLTLSAISGSLNINAAVAGFLPKDATATATYALTTNGTNMKILGQINSAMPISLQLLINLAAPTGATSSGNVAMGTTMTNLVTGITQVAQSGLAVTYTFHQTADVLAGSPFTRTLTLTLMQGP